MTISTKSLWTDRVRRWACSVGMGVAVMLPFVPHTQAQDQMDPRASSKVGSDVPSADDIQENWNNFRGPGANGYAPHAKPPLSWSAKKGRNILWKTLVPKHGMSSPVVWEKRVFLTGADDSSRQIYCIDADDGMLLWQHDVDGLPGFPPGSKLPRVLDEAGFAAPTATTNGQYVAAIFATGELVCVNMKGERVWAKHLGIPKNHYGHASSLISHKKLLFVQFDQKINSELLALDLATGDPVWQAKRGAISWSSPILIENRGRMELILVNSKAVDSYDPMTGKLLWHVECLDGEVASSAAYADCTVFVSNDGATTTAIDVRNPRPEPEILWQWDENLPDAASPLAKDGYLILPTAFGVVTCLEAKTGKVLWEREFDRGFYSSPILASDRVYMIDTSGSTQVFELDDEFKLLGVSEVGEGVYATPAVVGDRIYIRGLRHLFCIAADVE